MKTEIFRHFRPTELTVRRELKPQRNGGVSFMAIPADEPTVYNFWVYICPLSAGFSSKEAVLRLRENFKNGVMPWGSLILDERPLLDQLVEAAAMSELPSDIGRMLDRIARINISSKHAFDASNFKAHIREAYAND